MAYENLQGFVSALESAGELRRVKVEVDPILEITEIADRVMRDGGPGPPFRKGEGIGMAPPHQRDGIGIADGHGPRRRKPRRQVEGNRGSSRLGLETGPGLLPFHRHSRRPPQAAHSEIPPAQKSRPPPVQAGHRRRGGLRQPPRPQVLAGRRRALLHPARRLHDGPGNGRPELGHVQNAGLRRQDGGNALAPPQGRSPFLREIPGSRGEDACRGDAGLRSRRHLFLDGPPARRHMGGDVRRDSCAARAAK